MTEKKTLGGVKKTKFQPKIPATRVKVEDEPEKKKEPQKRKERKPKKEEKLPDIVSGPFSQGPSVALKPKVPRSNVKASVTKAPISNHDEGHVLPLDELDGENVPINLMKEKQRQEKDEYSLLQIPVELDSGFCGKLFVHESGKMTMKIGNDVYLVQRRSSSFVQTAVKIGEQIEKIGSVDHSVTCIPQFSPC